MSEPRLEHHTIKVRDLIDDYRAGRIVIPEFQREYVWRRGKAPQLIDSLYRGFPISSLLLWHTTEVARPRRRDPRPVRSGPMSWLIDGQQRVITLARTLSGDEGIEVVFHPGDEAEGTQRTKRIRHKGHKEHKENQATTDFTDCTDKNSNAWPSVCFVVAPLCF